MDPKSIVAQTLAAIEAHDLSKAAAYTADSLVVKDPATPVAVNKETFFIQMTAILNAFPDWRYDQRSTTVQGDQVTVEVVANATHTQPLQLPGLPPIPATGKKVSVPDRFIFAVTNDKITALTIASPANGGAAEMLRQLGIRLPRAQS